MYTLICGSPKIYSSNSLYFLKKLSAGLDKYELFELKNNQCNEILASIEKSDTIVFSFPLYVDSPTSIMLDFLDYIIDKKINLSGKYVYAIINCGFREGKQNITAVNIIKCWCKKVKAIYCCSLLIGAGEIVGKEKYKFITIGAMSKIKKFVNIMRLNKKHNDIITTVDLLNNKLYCYFANLSWNKKGKKNNLSIVDLKSK